MGSFTRGGAGDINEDRCIKGAWEFREKQHLIDKISWNWDMILKAQKRESVFIKKRPALHCFNR